MTMNQKKMGEYQFDMDMESMYEQTKKATLKDLCPQDKAKIGKLIKRLAEEKSEKEDLKQMFQSKKIQEEINQIDGEILNLLHKPRQIASKSTHQSPNFKLQSPNFKQLIPDYTDSLKKKKEFQLLFKQQLSYEASPSFFQSGIQTNREISSSHQNDCIENLSQISDSQSKVATITKNQNKQVQTTLQTPQKTNNNQSLSSVQQSTPTQTQSNRQSSKSKKKEILMAKIIEFEKLVQRMNFSKSQDYESSFETVREPSITQNVYRKILLLEEEMQRLSQKCKDSAQPNSRSSNQKDIVNEDDMLIELLNQTCWNPKRNSQSQIPVVVEQKETPSINSSLYGSSFLSLVDNIELTDARMQPNYSDQKKKCDVNQYAESVINKYNALVHELQYDFVRK